MTPPPHSEVKLRLLGPDGHEIAADAYARVTPDAAAPESFIVSFTALPPQLKALLDAAQQGDALRRPS